MNLFKERLEKISLYQQLRKVFFNPKARDKKQICPNCENSFEASPLSICPTCHHLFMMTAYQRLALIVDEKSFKEFDKRMKTKNGQDFEGYQEKLDIAQEKAQLNEAYIYGLAKIDHHRVVIGIMDGHFMMGSMGTIVGEKITRSIELATKNKLPSIIFTASGGARMQEGILSLVQMSKTTNALKQHSNKGLLSMTVLTHPTTGGVSASFAMITDIVLAEPKATIGFAGKRVIAQTINEALPDDFQSSEFNCEHGFIDQIVDRENLRDNLSSLLGVHV